MIRSKIHVPTFEATWVHERFVLLAEVVLELVPSKESALWIVHPNVLAFASTSLSDTKESDALREETPGADE